MLVLRIQESTSLQPIPNFFLSLRHRLWNFRYLTGRSTTREVFVIQTLSSPLIDKYRILIITTLTFAVYNHFLLKADGLDAGMEEMTLAWNPLVDYCQTESHVVNHLTLKVYGCKI